MANFKRAIKHDTKKGMGGYIRAQDWNYRREDHPAYKNSNNVENRSSGKRKRRRNSNTSTNNSSLKIDRSSGSSYTSNLNI